MNEAVDRLVEQCTRAARQGAAFPAIWEQMLSKHSLVTGHPVQTFDNEQPHLEVRLRNGYWLRYCARSNDFSLRRASLHRAF